MPWWFLHICIKYNKNINTSIYTHTIDNHGNIELSKYTEDTIPSAGIHVVVNAVID